MRRAEQGPNCPGSNRQQAGCGGSAACSLKVLPHATASGAPARRVSPNMARPAQEPVVLQSALAAAIGDRHDVVGLPSRPARLASVFRAARSEAGGRDRVHARCALTTSNPHSRQIPLSRFFTCCRTYHGLLRIFHSWTQASPQNVRRGGFTGRAAPAADRLPGLVPLGLPPLIRSDDARATGAHAAMVSARWAKGLQRAAAEPVGLRVL